MRRATVATAVIFAFDQAMIFNAPLIEVNEGPAASAPLDSATAVTDFASAAGAAWMELSAIATAITATERATPRLTKKTRIFSNERFTCMRAAFSVVPSAAATSLNVLWLKKRRTMASYSLDLSWPSAASRKGAMLFQALASESVFSVMDCM